MKLETIKPGLTVIFFCLCFSTISVHSAELASTATPPPSAGLINDLLRRESAEASAWDVGGEFRVRYELKDKAGSFPNRDFARNLVNSNDYFLVRTKVHLGWTPSSWFYVYAEGRDAHAFSDARPVDETDTFDLHQAYLRLGDSKQFPLSLRVGRQELIYSDQRYSGNADWSNLQRSFDAVKLRFESDMFWLEAFTGRQVLPRDHHFNVVNDYDWFSGIYASTRQLVQWQDTDFYFLARNVGAGSPTAITPTLGGPGPRDIYTLGTRWKSLPGKLGRWDYSFEMAGQFGSIVQGDSRLDHRAFAVNFSGGHTWPNTFGTPRLGLGYDFGSGDSNPTDGRHETFELLFGTNHRLYGNMDLMGLRNMHIPRLEASIKPRQNVNVSIEWLGFWLADTADFFYPESGAGRSQNGYGLNPDFPSYVGNELDVLVDWRMTSWGLLRAGYGHFFVGDYIRQSIDSVAADGGALDANWFYIQASVRF